MTQKPCLPFLLPPQVLAFLQPSRSHLDCQKNALNQSVVLDIAKTNTKDPDCPTDINDAGYCPDDDNADRRIVFMGNFHSKGDHTFTVPSEGLDSLASSNSNVLRITPNVDLVHGQQYMMIFRYRDYAANAEESTSNIVIFDSKTISPVFEYTVMWQSCSTSISIVIYYRRNCITR